MFIVNFSNQIAAGPKNIAKNFLLQAIAHNDTDSYIFLLPNLEEYKDIVNSSAIKSSHVFFVETGGNILTKIFRTMYVNFILPFQLFQKNSIKGFLSFGNFLLYPGKPDNKVVLLHHPYLVDDRLYKELRGVSRIAEFLKRIAFQLTALNVTRVIVQSDYMSSEFKQKYPSAAHKAHTISNPLSNVFEIYRSNNTSTIKKAGMAASAIRIVYVSRFYPHKNHRFLVELSRKIVQENINAVFIVTVDPALPQAQYFIEPIEKENLPIINAGEVTQHKLVELYSSSDIAIFPSLTETFGNPLIEAMCFSLPVLAVDLPYARDILGESGIFYDGTVEDCIEKILNLKIPENYEAISKLSFERSLSFPSAKEWYGYYKEQLENR